MLSSFSFHYSFAVTNTKNFSILSETLLSVSGIALYSNGYRLLTEAQRIEAMLRRFKFPHSHSRKNSQLMPEISIIPSKRRGTRCQYQSKVRSTDFLEMLLPKGA